MFRLSITPQWHLDSGDGPEPLPRLIELLTQIRETGSLSGACRELGLSYRYAWGLIKGAEQRFRAPLLQSRRGQGTRLSLLAERLIWTDRRISARLGPILDSMASELESEIERALTRSQGILRLHASHGFAVETLRRTLAEADFPLNLKYCTSREAVAALAAGDCDLAGFHVPTGDYQEAMFRYYGDALDADSVRLILLATRRQGLILAPGNPLSIHSLADVAATRARFINRQPGAGTRHLLDLMLANDGIRPETIVGYDSTEITHAAVAAYVASNMADAGFGVETPAQRFGLDFIPLVTERYFLACSTDLLDSGSADRLLHEMRSTDFRVRINALAGYDAMASGTVMSLGDAFGTIATR